MSLSKINKKITLEYLKEPENLYFDRKSAKVDLKTIANEVMSFANATGGTLAVGILDNGNIEGFNKYGIEKFNEYVIAPGQTIIELLEINNITQLELVSKTGISQKTINLIIKGKAPITVSVASKLEYMFNLPVSFWNNLENNYRESLENKEFRNNKN